MDRPVALSELVTRNGYTHILYIYIYVQGYRKVLHPIVGGSLEGTRTGSMMSPEMLTRLDAAGRLYQPSKRRLLGMPPLGA
jgi:hypothetical protein